MTEMRIGVVGCAGRMGQMLVRTIHEAAGCVLAGGSERPGSDAVGRDVGTVAGLEALGVAVGDDPAVLFAACDAVLDFTTPEASAAHAGLAAQGKVVHVIGTTGLGAQERAALDKAAAHTALVWAPNMSVGVTLLFALAERVAATLDADYDIEIVEMHHRNKVDAPSGTALGLGRAAAAGRKVDFDAVAVLSREGRTGARKRGDIGFATLRGGDVIGEHRAIFAGDGERIELAHICTDRRLFARGAVRAALWARTRPPGLYGMKDVLGL